MSLIRPRTTSNDIEALAEISLSHPSTNIIYIAGFAIVGVAVFSLLTWLGVRYFRKRALARRERELNASVPPPVRSPITTSNIGWTEKREPLPPIPPTIPETNRTKEEKKPPQLFLPDIPLNLPSIPTAEEIIQYHRNSGNFPRPFSFALNATSPPSSRRSSLLNPNAKRSSVGPPSPSGSQSSSIVNKRFSVVSTCSTVSSVQSAQGHLKKVRQVFTPVLPDELLLASIGERLTVLQTFDDGWCVAGRDNPAFKAASGPKSLFKSGNGKEAESNIELGVVPAWCFMKSVKGLRAERPVRSSSLGVTVHMEAPTSREEVISWSNF